MDFALMTEPHLGGSYEQLLSLAHWARDAGMAGFARSDHYYLNRTPRPDATDAFATMAGIARETDRIRLTVLVSPITFRHPAVIVKNAVTIDQMSGGRFDLGIGTGWYEFEHDAFGLPFPPWRERFDRLEEALQYTNHAIGRSDGPMTGRYYSLDADVQPKPAGLRLIVGGSGPRRTPALAGTYADEYNHFVATPEVIAPKIELLRAAAADAGRDPNTISVSMMGTILTSPDRSRYRARLEAIASRRGKDTDELEAAWIAEGVPMGSPEQTREMIRALEAVGVSTFYIQHLDLDDLSNLEDAMTVLA
jgi:alkanesulfonate monooxygenase SsuD/methylene tetrahydromethanopterin reductase-like flavin-dependent oxidoreductase (luciferase family)